MRKETKFKEVLGESPEIKILELLIEGRDFEYTLNDIVTGAKVNRNRAYEILRSYIKLGVIEKAKTVKNFIFYQLNKDKKEVKLLIQTYDTIVK